VGVDVAQRRAARGRSDEPCLRVLVGDASGARSQLVVPLLRRRAPGPRARGCRLVEQLGGRAAGRGGPALHPAVLVCAARTRRSGRERRGHARACGNPHLACCGRRRPPDGCQAVAGERRRAVRGAGTAGQRSCEWGAAHSRRYEGIQVGEPAELLVLSQRRSFDSFKARLLPHQDAWLSCTPPAGPVVL